MSIHFSAYTGPVDPGARAAADAYLAEVGVTPEAVGLGPDRVTLLFGPDDGWGYALVRFRADGTAATLLNAGFNGGRPVEIRDGALGRDELRAYLTDRPRPAPAPTPKAARAPAPVRRPADLLQAALDFERWWLNEGVLHFEEPPAPVAALIDAVNRAAGEEGS